MVVACKIEAYELKTLPILNTEKVTTTDKKKVQRALSDIIEAQVCGNKAKEDEGRKKLDKAVLDILGLGKKEREQVYEGLEALRRARLQRKEVGVLVETAEKWKPRKKPKKKKRKIRLEPSKRLDKWMKD